VPLPGAAGRVGEGFCRFLWDNSPAARPMRRASDQRGQPRSELAGGFPGGSGSCWWSPGWLRRRSLAKLFAGNRAGEISLAKLPTGFRLGQGRKAGEARLATFGPSPTGGAWLEGPQPPHRAVADARQVCCRSLASALLRSSRCPAGSPPPAEERHSQEPAARERAALSDRAFCFGLNLPPPLRLSAFGQLDAAAGQPPHQAGFPLASSPAPPTVAQWPATADEGQIAVADENRGWPIRKRDLALEVFSVRPGPGHRIVRTAPSTGLLRPRISGIDSPSVHGR